MASAPRRSKVSKHLKTTISEANFAVEMITAPKNAGWAADMGEAGSEFTPYLTITPQTSSQAEGSLGDPSTEWLLPYTLTGYGVHLEQLEDLMDDLRSLLLTPHRINLAMGDGTSWRLVNTQCSAIGGIGYDNSVDPTAYSQSDSYLLRLSRNLS